MLEELHFGIARNCHAKVHWSLFHKRGRCERRTCGTLLEELAQIKSDDVETIPDAMTVQRGGLVIVPDGEAAAEIEPHLDMSVGTAAVNACAGVAHDAKPGTRPDFLAYGAGDLTEVGV